jgi:hypothetical protein
MDKCYHAISRDRLGRLVLVCFRTFVNNAVHGIKVIKHYGLGLVIYLLWVGCWIKKEKSEFPVVSLFLFYPAKVIPSSFI